MTLIAVTDFRTRIGILPADSPDDEASVLLGEVTAQWEGLTGRPWLSSTDDIFMVRPNPRSYRLWLPRTPVSSLTTVEERVTGDGTWSEVADTDYLFTNATTGEVERLGEYWSENVRITYTGGYTATTTPDDVKHAIVTQAKFLLQRRQQRVIALRSTALKDGTSQYMEKADYHPLFASVAKRHRLYDL